MVFDPLRRDAERIRNLIGTVGEGTGMVKVRGIGWQGTIGQFSNKGPIVILEDSAGHEFCRVLVDVGTKKIRVITRQGYSVGA